MPARDDAPRRIAAPECLAEVLPPVEGLWALGPAPTSHGPSVAIVGSRNATGYGLHVARALGADLAARGFCVVSGLARGVDAAAHEGALLGGGATVAVLAGGVDRPYPAANAGLYRRILAAGGSIVSEQPPGATGRKYLFPARNRIIAGLSLGVVLVQGGERSGARSTVDFAGQLGRSVFAVPGDVRSDLSRLPHALLRDGATFCTGVGDIEAELASDLGRPAPTTEGLVPIPQGLGRDELAIAQAIVSGPASTDALAARAGLDVVAAMRAITRLELLGFARRDLTGSVSRRRRDDA